MLDLSIVNINAYFLFHIAVKHGITCVHPRHTLGLPILLAQCHFAKIAETRLGVRI